MGLGIMGQENDVLSLENAFFWDDDLEISTE